MILPTTSVGIRTTVIIELSSTTNTTSTIVELDSEWLYLVLIAMPVICIVGNCLVVAAVWTTKSLHTSTNYLLVSLAVADLVVGTFVMPFSIYLSVSLNIGKDNWVALAFTCIDVSHLLCLVAATKPAEYKTLKHKRRVYKAIVFAWIFSVGISLPLGSSITETESYIAEKHHCGIYNPVYMFSSSIFAFYLPCTTMIITYSYIFYALRKRLRAIQLQEMAGGQFLGFGADVSNITTSAMQSVIGIAPKNRNMITWEKPLLRKIEETAAEHASSLNDSEREQVSIAIDGNIFIQLQNILEAVQPSSSGSQSCGDLTTDDDNYSSDRPPSVMLEAVTLQQSTDRRRESLGSVLVVPQPSYVTRNMRRRFSDAMHGISNRKSSLEQHHRRLKTLSASSLPPDVECSTSRSYHRRRHSRPTDINRRTSSINESNGHLHGLRPPRTDGRRFSAPADLMLANREAYGEQSNEARKMRRLSELITDWDRPSRTSLGGLYSYARRESVYIARKKLAGLMDWALDLLAKLKSKQGMAIRRETRATKLVATVMVVFLVCWLPFFTLNMIKVYKLASAQDWPDHLEFLFHWFTALGYLNSSLNPVIYTAINQKFRSSFRRLLGLRSKRQRREKTWMLAPTDTSHNRQQSHNAECGCFSPFANSANRSRKTQGNKKKDVLRRTSSAGGVMQFHSLIKPEIVIEEVTPQSVNNVSISANNTTCRRSSDDCIRRSSSEIITGQQPMIGASYSHRRRSSAFSNSSASLQLHAAHLHDANEIIYV